MLPTKALLRRKLHELYAHRAPEGRLGGGKGALDVVGRCLEHVVPTGRGAIARTTMGRHICRRGYAAIVIARDQIPDLIASFP
jgi:hypothetical protein